MCVYTYLLTRDGSIHDNELTKRWTDGKMYVFYIRLRLFRAHGRFQGIIRPAATTDDDLLHVRERYKHGGKNATDGRTDGRTNVQTHTRTRSALADDAQRTGAQHDTTHTAHTTYTLPFRRPIPRLPTTASTVRQRVHIGGGGSGCSGTV